MIKNILQEFGISQVDNIEKLNLGGVNTEQAFLITTNANRCILKKVRGDHRKRIEKSSNLTKLLFEKGFEYTTKSIKSKSGLYTHTLVDGGTWELQEYLEGIHIKNTLLTIKNVQSVAYTLAELHSTFLNQNKPTAVSFDTEIPYKRMFDAEQHEKMVGAVEELSSLAIPKEDMKLLKTYWGKYGKVREEILKSLGNNDEKFQKSVIHRDLNKGNILFGEKSQKVAAFVDWSTVMWGNIIQDLCYLSSHYFLILKDGSIDSNKSVPLIQSFFDEYQKLIPLNKSEKEFTLTLVDILIVRATRWWTKRYLEIYKKTLESDKFTPKFDAHRGGFQKTLSNWLNNRDATLQLFSEIIC